MGLPADPGLVRSWTGASRTCFCYCYWLIWFIDLKHFWLQMSQNSQLYYLNFFLVTILKHINNSQWELARLKCSLHMRGLVLTQRYKQTSYSEQLETFISQHMNSKQLSLWELLCNELLKNVSWKYIIIHFIVRTFALLLTTFATSSL